MSLGPDADERYDFTVEVLGPAKVRSPYRASRYVSDEEQTLYDTMVRRPGPSPDAAAWSGGHSDPRSRRGRLLGFELAGPRERIYFDPSKTRCGIVTCGGLCPGLNNVIRAIVLQLYYHYGVRIIHGFRYGFEGLVPQYGHETIMLDSEVVSHIHEHGGSLLSSSRGPQVPDEVVDALERLNIQILFCIGGDGTFRGALALCREIEQRNLKIAIVAVPKTIDNDIQFTSRSFGFETAFSIAADALRGAHVESKGAYNGIGLVKLMGRQAGFIAAHAALANRDANFVLVPEVDFDLEGANGLLAHLHRRLKTRQHAVVVVAEGAGQHLFDADSEGATSTDPSGNVRLKDVGVLLRDRISAHLESMNVPFTLKYIDPSYLLRSAPSTPSDALFAGTLGRMAAHAAMAGKTAMFVGYWNGQFTHVPIAAAVAGNRRLDPEGNLWQSVVECTGQPRNMAKKGSGPFLPEAQARV